MYFSCFFSFFQLQLTLQSEEVVMVQVHIEYYEVGTLAVDGWAVTFGTARRGLGGAAASWPLLTVHTRCNSPPVNDQCTTHRIAV